jgi:F420-0:gamma-glutamyl ligase
MISFRPLKTSRQNSSFDIVGLIDELVGGELQDGDLLVISSKFMAISEGRIAILGSVTPGREARDLSERYQIDPRLCELIIREADLIIGGVEGFLLTLKSGLLTPNAGIDKSNIEHGRVVLYPLEPS